MRRSVFRTTLLLLACLLLPLSAQAQPRTPAQVSPLPPLVPAPVEGRGEVDDALRGKQGTVGVMIELSGLPTTQAFAQAQAAGQPAQAISVAKAQLAQVDQAQQRLLAPLASLGANVLYRTQRVYNGIAAHVDAGKLDALAALPGVKAIHPLIRHYPDLKSSVPLIGAPQLWAGTNLPAAVTGQGMKIAIIDTGVDYIHAGFGGPGTKAAYDRNDTTRIDEVPPLFPTAKVIGGYDFAGDDYTGFNAPHPDPDPMDCNGLGSHVAGIAAGNGVKSDGTAYTGPYNPSIYGTVNFKIGPGVAPQAQIIALRVFGCDGSTELVNQAIERAIDPNGDGDFSDRADVINMSLGSDFGYTEDPTSVAADNAVLAGTIVVASAGNDADTYYITGSPATSPRVISVASSVDATDILDGFRVNTPVSIKGEYPASNSVAYDWANSQPITGTLVYPPSQRTGCQPFSAANKALIAGKIVLLDWSDNECGSVTRGANLVAAGAIGGILVDNSPNFDLFITGSGTIPMVSTPKSVGDTLKGALASGTVQVTLSREYTSSVPYTDPTLVDTLSTFSSRGPRRNGSALKPDISAPGQGIFSVGTGTGTEGATISGTSQAAPHVAGAMALLRQLHPTWTIEELKALAMNTAVNNVRSDLDPNAALFPPSRIGAGRIDLPRAAASNVVAYDQGGPGLVSVSFGNVEVFGTATATRKIRILNKGASSATYNLAYAPFTSIPGVSYSLSASSVTVGAGQVADVTVTMTANAAQMKHNHDATVSETQAFGSAQLARPWISEASGYVVLTKSGAAKSNFTAAITGGNEVPPTDSAVRASGVFTYTASSNNIEYHISFSQPITLTAAHFHRGPAGVSGPIAVMISGGGTFGPGNPLTGNATLTAADAALLRQGGLYVNFHTAAHPGGEIRGQVVPSSADTVLRVPIYASARPAANMRAQQAKLTPTPSVGATVVLTGTGVNTGSNYPLDVVSLVSALELQYTSPNEASSNALNNKADLAYVGAASDVAASTLSKSMIYFGVATHGDWSTPNEVEFDIYIDTNRDGVDDYVLFNNNAGWMTNQDQNDIMLTFLLNLNTNDLSAEDYLNGVPPDQRDTAVFNNNVVLLPVAAADLGLTAANARFNYRVVSYSLDATGNELSVGGAIAGKVDESKVLTYDAAHPGLDTTGGAAGAPMYEDLPGKQIHVGYNPSAFFTSRSLGVLLFHHHNRSGQRVQVVSVRPPHRFLPIVRR
jgi:subtilisin family serine protease